MSAASKLYAALTGNAPLVAVVGTRIYRTIVPDGELPPAIAYRLSRTEYVQTIHGPVHAVKQGFDIFCVAVSQAVADQVGDLVEAISVSAPGVIEYVDRSDEYEAETELYATIITVSVWAP